MRGERTMEPLEGEEEEKPGTKEESLEIRVINQS
jgi:hypothetical protein